MLTRRAVWAGSAAVPLAFSAGSVAVAQSFSRDEKVLDRLADAKDRAIDLRNAVAESELPVAEVADEANSIVSEGSEAVEQIQPEDRRLYVEPSQSRLADWMVELGVPLTRNPDVEVVPTGQVGPSEPTEGKENLGDVIMDIVLQTLFGASVKRAMFTDLLSALGLAESWEALVAAVAKQDFLRAGIAFETILRKMFSEAGIAILQKVLGPEIFAIVLRNVGARFVPFIGWALLIVSFVQALRNNWERIKRAL